MGTRIARLSATMLLVLFSAGCDWFQQPRRPPEVERSSIVVGEAKRGDFMLRQGGDGVIKPDQTAEFAVSFTDAQVDDVQLGQPAMVKIGAVIVPGKVTQIDPPKRVGENQVVRRVVVTPTSVPKEVQPGSPIDVRINIMTVKDAIYIPRPALAPAQTLLYRLSSDQRSADPVRVEYGRIGIEYAEIRSGLKPGDRIIRSITAQYEPFGRISLR